MFGLSFSFRLLLDHRGLEAHARLHELGAVDLEGRLAFDEDRILREVNFGRGPVRQVVGATRLGV